MQPSPRADTSKLLFPSLRFCIVSPTSRLLKTNQPQRRRGTEDDSKSKRNTPVLLPSFSVSPCLCGLVAIFSSPLSLILFVADLFHPIDGLAVKMFQDGDVRHRCAGRGAVPM